MILAGDIYRDSRRRNKLIADQFRNFQAKQSLMDGTLESSEMAPKKKNTPRCVLKLSGKYTERYEGSQHCFAVISLLFYRKVYIDRQTKFI